MLRCLKQRPCDELITHPRSPAMCMCFRNKWLMETVTVVTGDCQKMFLPASINAYQLTTKRILFFYCSISEVVVQKRWKYLRDCFRAENVKIPQSRSRDASSNATPSWTRRQQLFLKDHVKKKMSQGNLQTAQADNTTTDSCCSDFCR